MGAIKLSDISRTQKIAVIIVSLGPEEGAKILKSLEPNDALSVLHEIKSMPPVSKESAEAIMAEFHSFAISLRQESLQNGEDFLNSLANHLTGSRLESALSIGSDPTLTSLEGIPSSTIGKALSGESSQTVALTLSLLEPKKASEILFMQHESKRLELILRLANLGEVDTAVIEELDHALGEKIAKFSHSQTHTVGGVSKVAEILKHMNPLDSDQLLEKVESKNPELASQTREELVQFDIILRLSDQHMQTLLNQTKTLWSAALRGTPETIKQKVYKNLSERARTQLIEEISSAPKMRISDVRDSQREIIDTLLRLESEGKCEVQDPNEVYV